MAEVSIKEWLYAVLRTNKVIYRYIRGIWRFSESLRLNILRICSPAVGFIGLPKGTFFLVERIRTGEVVGNIFFEQQETVDFSDDSLTKRAELNQDGFQPWPVFWAKMDDARLVGPNLLLLDHEKRACAEAMFGAQFVRFDKSYNYFNLHRPQEFKGNWTSLPGRFGGGYWHFLMDTVPRLHALPEFPSDTKILVRPGTPSWQMEIFEMIGVQDRVVKAKFRCADIEHYYFSSFTSMAGAWNPFAVKFLQEKFLPAAGVCEGSENNLKITDNQRNLFIKRSGNWTRGIRNQGEVIRFFEDQGWRILEPEKYSVKEQIRIFSQAEAVCGMHGSALTNILWMSPNATVLELVADNFILGSFEWLARCVGLKHGFLMFPGDHRFSMTVDVELLAEKVNGLSI